jgi:hypothetical protein
VPRAIQWQHGCQSWLAVLCAPGLPHPRPTFILTRSFGVSHKAAVLWSSRTESGTQKALVKCFALDQCAYHLSHWVMHSVFDPLTYPHVCTLRGQHHKRCVYFLWETAQAHAVLVQGLLCKDSEPLGFSLRNVPGSDSESCSHQW